jgi:hypothetical protein
MAQTTTARIGAEIQPFGELDGGDGGGEFVLGEGVGNGDGDMLFEYDVVLKSIVDV